MTLQPRPRRLTYRIFGCPARVDPADDCIEVDTKPTGPLGERQGFTQCGYFVVAASIVVLFFLGGPLAVGGPSISNAFLTMTAGIVPVVVFSLYRVVSGGTRPHIFGKGFRVFPSLTNANTSASVIGVSMISRRIYPYTHVYPNVVDICSKHAMKNTGATATCGMPVSESVSGYDNGPPAGTHALPIIPFIHRADMVKDGQPSEVLARQINSRLGAASLWLASKLFVVGQAVRIRFSHWLSPLKSMFRGLGMYPHLAASFA